MARPVLVLSQHVSDAAGPFAAHRMTSKDGGMAKLRHAQTQQTIMARFARRLRVAMASVVTGYVRGAMGTLHFEKTFWTENPSHARATNHAPRQQQCQWEQRQPIAGHLHIGRWKQF